MRQRASSPKLVILNNGLINAMMSRKFAETSGNETLWGRLVENAVGAHLFNRTTHQGVEIFYWREGDREVDYFLKRGDDLIAVEVKSGSLKNRSTLELIRKKYGHVRTVSIGKRGCDIDLERFLASEPLSLF